MKCGKCRNRYGAFAFDPPISFPTHEEDRRDNEYALALFYTAEAIKEYWANQFDPTDDGDDRDTYPGVFEP